MREHARILGVYEVNIVGLITFKEHFAVVGAQAHRGSIREFCEGGRLYSKTKLEERGVATLEGESGEGNSTEGELLRGFQMHA